MTPPTTDVEPIRPSVRPPEVEAGREPSRNEAPNPSRQSRRALDWFVFFVADVQTGFGPFVAVYLTSQKWTQTDIGLILTVSGLVSLFGQVPAGALIDKVRSVRMIAAAALMLIGASAFALAAWPIFPIVLLSRFVHAAASCVLGLAIASISLNLVGRVGMSARLGRNASFASIGTGLAAGGMGLCGYYWSNQAVFFIAAALVAPALASLFRIRSHEMVPITGQVHTMDSAQRPALLPGLLALAHNRSLLIFGVCVVLFFLANSAMLPLAASMLTLRSHEAATAMVAAAIVVPQAIVAVLSPLVGLKAQQWGRRPMLIIGFAALPLRGLLFALVADPRLLVAIQVLDGVSAAVLGVLVPLTVADVTRKSGYFNLAQGAVGSAVGIGAAVSTTMVGYLADQYGSYTAFVAMAVVAVLGLAIVCLFMPETRDSGTPTSATLQPAAET